MENDSDTRDPLKKMTVFHLDFSMNLRITGSIGPVLLDFIYVLLYETI